MDSAPLDLVTADGVSIAATLFPAGGPRRGAVLIVPAMGVSQSYYAPLASWLASHGFACLTFDFRGIGRSRPRELRGFEATVLDWARLDAGAALARLSAEARSGAPLPEAVPLSWIGHSLGGQIFPFVPGREAVARMVTVATGSGYWLENTPALRRTSWWLWFVAVPVALRLCGYFPGKRLRKVGDLPRGVMAQWRRWCLHPDYAAGAEPGARELYAGVRTPIVSFSFTDDEFMSRRNVESIHGFYSGASVRLERIAPRDVGVPRIGHFGFFRPAFADTLWTRLLPELA